MRTLALLALVFPLSALHAEVPPRSAESLDKEATLIVVGKITNIKSSEPKLSNSGTEITYDITITVGTISKGKLGDLKSIVVQGRSFELARGFVGSSGHRDAKTSNSIRTLAKDDAIKVHLGEGKAGVYPILFPNGFEVITKAKK